ncbi:Trk system potassium transporter TrkA [Falsigemmobacter faecalis]|uniref:Trk system potassium uptake protein TrkA n=1 Tax=Falsigemmobacter faecalis TaxID=2488730 RepID=A0A3P3DT35_9RHOB|nr:Trk system potassium transporter TrkA [Falsigemmobacter faecalis]RRH75848.1 Trk system potassium transporter TrkA [Falsigemmobacter faecalis]
MKVIICGAGQVGWQIARHLAGEGNDVTLIDTNPELIRRASEILDVQGITGFASHPDVLARAGAQDVHMIIAATHSDEVNMVVCQMAHSMFRVPRKIARLRTPAYLAALNSNLYRSDHLPIDVIISPEVEVAEAALQRIEAPTAFDTEAFLENRARLLGLALEEDCPVLNTPLRHLSDLFPNLRAVVVGIRRDQRLFAPEPGDQLLAGDRIYVFSHADDVARTLEIFGKSPGPRKRVVIVGAGNVGLTVAKALETRPDRIRVRLIERNRARAEAVADELSRSVVLNGDGLDRDLLEEADIDRADAVLVLTEDDRTNLLVAVRARQMGCRMSIALINDPTMVPLTEALDVDAWINPRSTTVSSILKHIRHGRVRAIYSLEDGAAEVIEAQVLSTSLIAGKLIGDLPLPEGAMIGMIRKGTEILRPHPDLRISEGDMITLFVMAPDIPEVERLLQVSVDYF